MTKFLYRDSLNKLTEKEIYDISDYVNQFLGIPGALRPVRTNAAGKIDSSLIDSTGSGLTSRFTSFDRVESVSYLDYGTRNERIASIAVTSDDVPGSSVVINVFWADVGRMNERISKLEFIGPSESIRKNFNYSLQGIRYRLDSTSLEVI